MTCSSCPDPEFGRCPCEQMAAMRGPYGQIITIKPLHDIGAESRCRQSSIPTFLVGDTVKVGNISEWIGSTSPAHPHLNQTGVVVSRLPGRLYKVRFPDGAIVGFYANELVATAAKLGTSASVVGRA